ncbi:MAG: sugar ABC transporter permease [Spirochaetales bacterium]|nr:sugar ABC transporter permease [Spirochaetales bacterium]
MKVSNTFMNRKNFFWLISPSIIFLLIIQVYPAFYSWYLSFGSIKGGKYTFVGLKNFVRLLNNSDFYESLVRTGVFTFSFLIACIGIGLILALLLNRCSKFTSFYMTIIFIPMVLSEVVGGTMWRWMFQQSFGLVQVFLNPYINNFSILSRPGGAMAVVIAASVWKQLAFTALLFLGALQTVPKELFESAALDGATRSQMFWKITWVIIRPTVLLASIMTTIRGINALGLILATTQGGPGAATMTEAVLLYRTAWQFGRFGDAAALSVMMFLINITLGAVYIRLLRDS